MIRLFNRVNELNHSLLGFKKDGSVSDFRICLTLNNEIRIIVKEGTLSENQLLGKLNITDDEMCDFYSKKQAKEESFFLDQVFEKTDSTIYINSTRRRMSHFFERPSKILKDIPVITFYSYKGGVGRSTTLASCAAYLSYHESKKIVILDCDFEAPGFTNFFMEEPDSPIYKEGLVEYFIDEQTSNNPILSKYYWQVSKQFSGSGDIYVFPAGNLDDTEEFDGIFNTHRAHYLNGLARIDMFSPNALAERFQLLFSQIKNEINPDVILIDSRTGFNDIFGLSAFRLSDALIGFFGNNIQSLPGLDFFLDLIKQETAPRLLLVNSIIPSTHRRDRINSFNEYVNEYLKNISLSMETDDSDNQFSVESFSVSSNDILNNIGTRQEDYRDFMDMIHTKSFPDYNFLFDRIGELLKEILHIEENNIEKNDGVGQGKIKPSHNNSKSRIKDIKHKILENLQKKMPQLYAEHVPSYLDEYRNMRYFYRACMEDLFNPNKLLIIGNKGTGKTYIYKSLKEREIVVELQKRARQKGDFLFIQAVDVNRRFDTIKFNDIELNSLDYERFWMVYIWNIIMSEVPFGYKTKIPLFKIFDDTHTRKEFLTSIKDDDTMMKIEQDLRDLDDYLFEGGERRIVVLFDELDNIVNPIQWSERIAPLINLCKKMSYRTISPKLFVRSDLYEKTSNINNKNALKNRSITIEWNSEELFAFFFKHLFSHSASEFFEIMKLYGYYPSSYVNKLHKNLEKNNNQIPLDEYILKQLCGSFFGEYADVNNSPRFGKSYEWFFKNLQNSNGTLSLRPFIDLISISVEQALVEDNTENPILSPLYYTMGKNRAKAVEHHFEDLAAESGNEDLKPIIEYIRDHIAKRYKRVKLSQKEFFSLLDCIIGSVDLRQNKDRDSIIRFLEINGIISQSYVRSAGEVYKQYAFALLYKYYLGLRSSRPRRTDS